MEILATVQGLYYILTGLWPAFNVTSFEKLTGPKTDKWLVKMVGLLAASVGVVLLIARDEKYIQLLAILSASSFAIIDFTYSIIGRISKIYLLDGITQLGFIVGWTWLSVTN